MSGRIALGLTPQILHAAQSLLLEPCIGHGLLVNRGSGHVAVTTVALSLPRGRDTRRNTRCIRKQPDCKLLGLLDMQMS